MSSSNSSLLASDFGWNLRLIVGASTLIATGFVLRGISYRSKKQSDIILSPRQTLLPRLSRAEVGRLPYPPDALPNPRDVETPYGTIRAYEWGPEQGRKVLLVHGISTPCLALGSVAHGLVERGHRVMLFDLFGRGYSDTPSDLNHDIRLFTTQTMLVLTSSPLAWTGPASGRFALLGYSLGGGIAASFASYFPDLINSLILIAPSGLIRKHNLGLSTRLLYSQGLIPETVLERAVRRRLKTPLFPNQRQPEDINNLKPQDAIKGEMINVESNDTVVLSKSHPDVTIEKAVSHQVDNHAGFVRAFMSSIRHGPITDQHDRWRVIGQLLTKQNATTTATASSSPTSNRENQHEEGGGGGGFENGKVLIIVGRHDVIIKTPELVPDATDVLEGNVEFRYIDAGHEAPIKHGDQVVEYIMEFWR